MIFSQQELFFALGSITLSFHGSWVVSLTPSLIDVSPGFHGSTAAPSVLDPQSRGVIIGWESKFPSDFFVETDV